MQGIEKEQKVPRSSRKRLQKMIWMTQRLNLDLLVNKKS